MFTGQFFHVEKVLNFEISNKKLQKNFFGILEPVNIFPHIKQPQKNTFTYAVIALNK